MSEQTTETPVEDSIIRVEDFTTGYRDTIILRDLNFEIKRGEVFVVLGGSGCGKSTLLKHMIGLLQPKQGRIFIGDRDLVQTEGTERLGLLKRIGVMYQQGALFGSMNVLENVRLPMEEYTDLPLEAMDMIGRMKLKLVGLAGFGLHMPDALSGGMRKRAAIARAMALDPEVLFLDEPSAGLDPITSAELDHLIRTLSRNLGITFVIVTHELPSIMSIADRVIMLDKREKGIVAEGDPREIAETTDHPWVRQFFHREASLPGENS